MAKKSKTVNNAAELLPVEIREQFKRAFGACKCMDIYDGNPQMYLTVIAQTLEDLQARHHVLKRELVRVIKEHLLQTDEFRDMMNQL